MLINSYTTGISSTVLQNILTIAMKRKFGGSISSGEIGLPITHSGMILPCGILARWEA
jgi:23S rRNA (cytosine1962-C5)-methyltransferase